MAKFSPPWASVGGVTRSPTVDEQNDGFPCGPLDLDLWNRLVQGIHAELAAIQDAGGITGTEGDDTTVLQAIEALISAATGGGDTSQFVLFSQAQARLPIFPEVTTNNGVIAVTSPGTGQIRIPASATILHRGIRTYTTVQTDLATVLSKTYHLRWNPTTGFALKDLADTGYNPTVAAETNAAFDTTYDDMLVARIVTNSSNVPTITNLTNKALITRNTTIQGTNGANLGADSSMFDITDTYNWARTPTNHTLTIATKTNNGDISDTDFNVGPISATLSNLLNNPPEYVATRYGTSQRVLCDWTTVLYMHFNARA